MLEFVRLNQDTRPCGSEDSPHSIIVLADHTAVTKDGNRYTFIWHQPTQNGTNMELRDVLVEPDQQTAMPRPVNRAATVGGAPSRDMVVDRALKELEKTERLARKLQGQDPQVWLENEPEATFEEVARIAPSLIQQATAECRNGMILDELYETADIWTGETAEENIRDADPDEMAQLRKPIGDRIQAREKEEAIA